MVVGLTGGIGSGKTTVGKLFKKKGIPVYDSDKEAKKLMTRSKKLKKEITQLFGEKAYRRNRLNRKFLAAEVFNDAKLLEQLNAIVHPEVKKHFTSWYKKQKVPYCIQEAAILFENGSYINYDKMILVTAPKETRILRIMERDGSTKASILRRMKNQWPDSKKRKLADFVIVNTDLEKTKKSVTRIHSDLLKISG